jgi:hypothetical protein
MTSNPLAMIMPINDLVCAPNSKTDFHNKPKKCIQLSHLRLSRIYLASLSIPNWLNGLVRSLKPRLFRLIPPQSIVIPSFFSPFRAKARNPEIIFVENPTPHSPAFAIYTTMSMANRISSRLLEARTMSSNPKIDRIKCHRQYTLTIAAISCRQLT